MDNKANKACIELLSEYLNVKKNMLNIVKGEKEKNKVVMVIKKERGI